MLLKNNKTILMFVLRRSLYFTLSLTLNWNMATGLWSRDFTYSGNFYSNAFGNIPRTSPVLPRPLSTEPWEPFFSNCVVLFPYWLSYDSCFWTEKKIQYNKTQHNKVNTDDSIEGNAQLLAASLSSHYCSCIHRFTANTGSSFMENDVRD